MIIRMNINEQKTIREVLQRLPDADLITLLPYIRDENGEKVSLYELKHILKEGTDKNGSHDRTKRTGN